MDIMLNIPLEALALSLIHKMKVPGCISLHGVKK